MTKVRPRFVSATVGMKSGCVIYGLHRVDLLERCGVFHSAIIPDRILNEQLAMIGEFRQVDAVLWQRRYLPRDEPIKARQIRVLFPDRAPRYTRLPYPLVHGAFLTWFVLVRGSTRPEVGRVRATLLVLWYTAWMSRGAARQRLGKRYKQLTKRYRRTPTD
jgi:hypothetical protein